MDLIFDNISIILWLPLWTFLIIIFGQLFPSKIKNNIISLLTIFSSFLGILFCSFGLFLLPIGQIIEKEFNFIQIQNFMICGGLFIDKISLVFALTLFLTSFFVQIFSIDYIKQDEKHRFFALLNLFNFVMVSLFFSPNLFQVYFLWEIVGVISYLLIGFEYSRKRKSVASQKVFLINRFGDMLLLSGLLFCSYFIFTYAGNIELTSIPFMDINIISTLIYAYTTTPIFFIICLLFIFSACVKSAQLPFFPWLQDAMEAKLPVSALLHSATMVALGLFSLLRLSAFFVFMPVILKIIATIGLLTALICSICACTKNNPKKILAYSTSAQLGLMFFAIGVLNIKACVAFFIAHAFIKTLLFLALPIKKDKWNYTAFVLFLLSGLSLIGLILSGFIAKDLIYLSCTNKLFILTFNVIIFLTAFYTIRLIYKLMQKHKIQKFASNTPTLFSSIGLFLLNIILYILFKKIFQYKIAEPFWIGLISSLFVGFLYWKNKFFKIKFLYSLGFNGFYFDKFYSKVITKQYNCICLALNNCEVKVLNNYKIILLISTSAVYFIQQVENTINNILTNLTQIIKNMAKFNLTMQTKNVQQYNTYAFFIITIVVCFFVITNTN